MLKRIEPYIYKICIGIVYFELLAISFTCGQLYSQKTLINPHNIQQYNDNIKLEILSQLPKLDKNLLHNCIKFVVKQASKKYNIEEDLIYAVMWQESRWNPLCVSNKGALGLMQIMPDTAKDLNIKNPYSIKENIEGGVKYLKWLQDRNLSNIEMLMAYNWGIGNLRKYQNGKYKKIPKETSDYVIKINNHLINRPWETI